MAPLILKIKGSKGFTPFADVGSIEELSKTWRVITKVKDSLEDGSRLENLSWRLWHLHSLVLDGCPVEPFRKLSAQTTAQLDSNHKATAPLAKPRKTSLPESNLASGKAGRKKTKKNSKKPLATDSGHGRDVPLSPASPDEFRPHAHSQPVSPEPEASTNGHIAVDALGQPNTLHANTTHGAIFVAQNEDEVSPFTLGGAFTEPSLQIDDMLNSFGGTAFVGNLDNPPHIEISMEDIFGPNPNWAAVAAGLGQPSHHHPALGMMMPAASLNATGPRSSVGLPHAYSPAAMSPAAHARQASAWPFTTMGAQAANNSFSFTVPTASFGMGTMGMPSGNHVVPSTSEGPSQASDSNQSKSPSPSLASRPNEAQGSGINPAGGDMTRAPMAPASLSPGALRPVSSEPGSDQGSTSSEVHSPLATPDHPQDGNGHLAANATTINGKPSTGASEQCCANCGVTRTPLWRRSENDRLLCNACGLYYKLHHTNRPKTLRPHSVRKDAKSDDPSNQTVCANCATTTTPLWRRDESGATLCNACGLYYKLHRAKRPSSLMSGVIRKRQRYDSSAGGGGRNRKGKAKDGGKKSLATNANASGGHIKISAPTGSAAGKGSATRMATDHPIALSPAHSTSSSASSQPATPSVFALPNAPIVATVQQPGAPASSFSPTSTYPAGPRLAPSPTTGGELAPSMVTMNGHGGYLSPTHPMPPQRSAATLSSAPLTPNGAAPLAYFPPSARNSAGGFGASNNNGSSATHSLINFTSFHGSGY
ncbi:hypothetical protein H4R35_002183 [Dimargaris xerosporica]|nr:hypothetical protein H4R35_002183 [Dimargaris xerosporica]